MSISKKAIGSRIKSFRKMKHLTQEQLSEQIDVTQRQLVRLEAGSCYPSVETLWKMSKVFDVDINSILKPSDEVSSGSVLKNEINNILCLAKDEQLKLIKNIIVTILQTNDCVMSRRNEMDYLIEENMKKVFAKD